MVGLLLTVLLSPTQLPSQSEPAVTVLPKSSLPAKVQTVAAEHPREKRRRSAEDKGPRRRAPRPESTGSAPPATSRVERRAVCSGRAKNSTRARPGGGKGRLWHEPLSCGGGAPGPVGARGEGRAAGVVVRRLTVRRSPTPSPPSQKEPAATVLPE